MRRGTRNKKEVVNEHSISVPFLLYELSSLGSPTKLLSVRIRSPPSSLSFRSDSEWVSSNSSILFEGERRLGSEKDDGRWTMDDDDEGERNGKAKVSIYTLAKRHIRSLSLSLSLQDQRERGTHHHLDILLLDLNLLLLLLRLRTLQTSLLPELGVEKIPSGGVEEGFDVVASVGELERKHETKGGKEGEGEGQGELRLFGGTMGKRERERGRTSWVTSPIGLRRESDIGFVAFFCLEGLEEGGGGEGEGREGRQGDGSKVTFTSFVLDLVSRFGPHFFSRLKN